MKVAILGSGNGACAMAFEWARAGHDIYQFDFPQFAKQINRISAAGGITSSYLQEVAVNRSMLAQCNGPKIVMADSSKIGVCQNFVDYGLDQITHLITDSGANKRELDQIRAKGVEVIVVEVKKNKKNP